MPNWSPPGKDYPSREDIQKMEREDTRRNREYAQEQNRVQRYLSSHPSASWAEAQYKTRNSLAFDD